jgi:chorismate synthase
MSNNSIGHIFKVTSFGESHGHSVGCLIEGIPAGLMIDVAAMQAAVDLRKTNQTAFASARNEADQIEIISGVFQQKTLGSPICIIIKNKDAQSADYDELKDVYRPNHADYTTQQKYGFRDHRGGGRSSIRITAPLVAAGALALQLVHHFFAINVSSFVYQIGDVAMPQHEMQMQYTHEQIFASSLRCPSATSVQQMEQKMHEAQENGTTLGGCIQTTITNLPVGLGEPIFEKLQAALGKAMLSINTVKGFEYGDGFAAAAQNGMQHNDVFEAYDGKVSTSTNHSGGIQGGISNGMPIVFRTAFKPISSIKLSQNTINQNQENTTIQIKGRHDVCAVPRAIPIVNAYTAIVLADMVLQHQFSIINKN